MKKKAEERREQILRAAFRAVSDKGYETVTLQDIADYAAVSMANSAWHCSPIVQKSRGIDDNHFMRSNLTAIEGKVY